MVVASPRDGQPIRLSQIATAVWGVLDDWIEPLELERTLEHHFPEVPSEVRSATLREVLADLMTAGLVEQSSDQ